MTAQALLLKYWERWRRMLVSSSSVAQPEIRRLLNVSQVDTPNIKQQKHLAKCTSDRQNSRPQTRLSADAAPHLQLSAVEEWQTVTVGVFSTLFFYFQQVSSLLDVAPSHWGSSRSIRASRTFSKNSGLWGVCVQQRLPSNGSTWYTLEVIRANAC